MAGEAPTGFRFLYRTEQGRIDRNAWARAAMPILVILLATTAVARDAAIYANRPLAERAFYDPLTFAANAYILAYAACLLLLGISWVNLAAKRFRDRGRPAPLGLAGLLPLAALVAGAAHWLQPRVAEVMPRWCVWGCDILLIAVAAWTMLELFEVISAKRRP